MPVIAVAFTLGPRSLLLNAHRFSLIAKPTPRPNPLMYCVKVPCSGVGEAPFRYSPNPIRDTGLLFKCVVVVLEGGGALNPKPSIPEIIDCWLLLR